MTTLFDNTTPLGTAPTSYLKPPPPPRFYVIVYLAAFLLSLGGGFLGGKTSFITINFFAGTDCTGVKSDDCNNALNLYTAASGITTFISLGFAIVLVPLLARASDALGRRRFIQIGAVMSCWPISVVLYELTGLSLWLMFALSFVASQSPVNAVAQASICDVTPEQDKSKVLGRRSALFVLGSTIGLACSYVLSDLWASVACMICTALSVMVHIVWWPETLSNTDRVQFECGGLNPLKPLMFFFRTRSYRYLFFVMLVEQLAGSGFNALVFNYSVKTFNASQSLFISALTVFNLGSALMPGLLLPLLKYWGCSDLSILHTGLLGMSVSFGLIAFIPNLTVFFFAAATLGVGGLVSPAAFSIVSSRTSQSEQGLAQGAFSAVTSVSSVIAQVTFDSLFILGNTKFNDPGFAFYFALGFCLLAFACALLFGRSLEAEERRSGHSDYSELHDELADVNVIMINPRS